MWLRRVGWRTLALPGICGAVLLLEAGCTPRRASEEAPTGASSEQPLNAATGLVISQVYGGTGGTGALFNRDFVELFNRSQAPVSLAGLQIHFAGSVGDFVLAATLPTGSVPPGGYFLVGFAAGEQGQDLRVDAAGSAVNVLPSNGKVALVRDVPVDPTNQPDAAVQQLACGGTATRCKSERVLDLVGYGVASDHEGLAAAPAPGVALAILRRDAGCTDSGDNAADFEALAPGPRTSKSPARLCAATGTP